MEQITISKLVDSDENLEPETLEKLFPLLSSFDRQQILALRVLKYTRAAYEDMEVFENVVNTLNGIEPNVEVTEGTRPEFIWRALDVIFEIYPTLELAEEIEQYTKFIFDDNGYHFYHPKLKLDNPHLSAIIQKSVEGPFPLSEDFYGIQAFKYLYIQEYLKKFKQGA